MPKYLIEASYTETGLAGLSKSGGSSRVIAVEKMCADLGGRVESFHFGFGKADAYVIVDLPDNEAAAAVAIDVGKSGAASCRTIVLLTPEEVDRAVNLSVDYRPPGS